MTMRLIAGASALSEFQGYTGDCGETAELAALHVVDAARFPLTAQMLNAIVVRDVQHNWASANGGEPIGAIADDLALVGIHYTNYGYSEPFVGCDWKLLLDQIGGTKPIIFEYARAGALPGDEPGVQYHFNTCLGWDADAHTGLFADGDNFRASGNVLAAYSEQDLVNAQVCAVLVVEEEVVSVGIPAGWKDDGKAVLTAPNGQQVKMGFRDYILGHAWYPGDVPLGGESGMAGGGTQQDFRYTRLTWTAATNVMEHDRLDVLELQIGQDKQQMAQDQQIIAALHTQVAQLQQQAADPKGQAAEKILDAIVAYSKL